MNFHTPSETFSWTHGRTCVCKGKVRKGGFFNARVRRYARTAFWQMWQQKNLMCAWNKYNYMKFSFSGFVFFLCPLRNTFAWVLTLWGFWNSWRRLYWFGDHLSEICQRQVCGNTIYFNQESSCGKRKKITLMKAVEIQFFQPKNKIHFFFWAYEGSHPARKVQFWT